MIAITYTISNDCCYPSLDRLSIEAGFSTGVYAITGILKFITAGALPRSEVKHSYWFGLDCFELGWRWWWRFDIYIIPFDEFICFIHYPISLSHCPTSATLDVCVLRIIRGMDRMTVFLPLYKILQAFGNAPVCLP